MKSAPIDDHLDIIAGKGTAHRFTGLAIAGDRMHHRHRFAVAVDRRERSRSQYGPESNLAGLFQMHAAEPLSQRRVGCQPRRPIGCPQGAFSHQFHRAPMDLRPHKHKLRVCGDQLHIKPDFPQQPLIAAGGGQPRSETLGERPF